MIRPNNDLAPHEAKQDGGKQGILEILNLEDSGPICAFAIERSRGVFSVAGTFLRNSVFTLAGRGCSILET